MHNHRKMAFKSNPRRDAWGTIAGFVFQVHTTILRWISLNEGEVLELERGEDIDLVQAELAEGPINVDRVLVQTKRRTSGGVTLNSPEAIEAIANFAEHRAVNPSLRLRFCYVTTAAAGIERGWPDENGGIPTWEALRRSEFVGESRTAALAKIRNVLSSCEYPESAADKYLKGLLSSDDQNALWELIQAYEWSTGADDYPELEAQIKDALLKAGYRDSETGSQQLLERLFVHVFRRLAQKGLKRLTKQELFYEVSETKISDVDHALFQFVRSQTAVLSTRISKVEEEVQKLSVNMKTSIAALVEKANVAISLDTSDTEVILDSPELVSPVISRQGALQTILDDVAKQTLTIVVDEPGSGKTQLCLLAAQQIKLPLTWINIPRGSAELEACVTLDRAVELLSGFKRQNRSMKEWYSLAAQALRGKLVVIDDLPRMMPGGMLARRLETLTNCLEKEGLRLLATSFYRLPSMSISFGEVDAPRLTDLEVGELLELYGAPPAIAKQWSAILATLTQGIVVLAVAAARYCSAQQWEIGSKLDRLLRSDFSMGLRQDSKFLVELTVPDVEGRALLYRLLLTVGGFSRKTVERVATVAPQIALPGEKLDRLIGLWVQPFVADKFILSPLLDPSFGSYLDHNTRVGVHAVLALEILSRRVLDPLQVVTCIHHFNTAGLFDEGALVLTQALLELTEDDKFMEQNWGLATLWVAMPIPPEADINLRIYARTLQTLALDAMGLPVEPALDEVARLIAEAGHTAWGAVIASGFLASHLYSKFPQLSNQFFLIALRGFGVAPLPGGTLIPRPPALEWLVWATANAATSDADVESWIDTVRQLSQEQVQQLAESDLAGDNAVILTDGIWLREYTKAGEKDWGKVEALVERLEKLGEEIGLPILRAAAIRTLIMLRAEFLNDIEGAVKFAEQELARVSDDECVFLIVEVTGRQLAYANRSAAATTWLKRARSIVLSGHSLWRRNVLITLAEEEGASDTKLAVSYVKEAVDLSRAEDLATHRIIEVLEEYAALWNADDVETALVACEEAVQLVFTCDESDAYWKKLFLAVFDVIYYLSSMTLFGKPPSFPNYQPPKQGQFLALDSVDPTKFVPAQKAFLKIRMAMFAEA